MSLSNRNGNCDPSSSEDVFDYVSKQYALPDKAYRYTGTDDGECRLGSVPTSGAVTLSPEPGYDVIPADIQLVKQALVDRGPLAAYWYVEENFFAYDSGGMSSDAGSSCRMRGPVRGFHALDAPRPGANLRAAHSLCRNLRCG